MSHDPHNFEPGSDGRDSGSAAPAAAPAPAGIVKQAVSFAASMARFAASGFKTVDAEIHQLRVDRCEPCEHRKANRCTVCGCFIDKKAWLPHEDCPLGRWVA